MSWFYVVATLVAAMLIGFGFVLQQHAAEQVRTDEFLRPGLIARLVRNRRWLGGQPLRRAEIIGALLLTAGVAALSATRTVKAPGESFGSFSHWPVAAFIA